MRSAYGLHWIQCNNEETSAHWRRARSGVWFQISGRFRKGFNQEQELWTAGFRVFQISKQPTTGFIARGYVYIEEVSAGWLSQSEFVHHRATDQLGPPHCQAGKAFSPKFHTPSWLLAPLSWDAGKNASNRLCCDWENWESQVSGDMLLFWIQNQDERKISGENEDFTLHILFFNNQQGGFHVTNSLKTQVQVPWSLGDILTWRSGRDVVTIVVAGPANVPQLFSAGWGGW